MHLLSVSQLTKENVMEYIHRAKTMHTPPSYPNKTVLTLFYEPSTRTSCSFQSAAHKLGCNVIPLTDKTSSSQKGETLEDTVRTLSFYGDVLILRHPEKGSVQRAASVSRIPIINAGDGNGEHPTQALLDVYTMYTELERQGRTLDSMTVTFVGDLKNSRTVHSLILLLALFPRIRFLCVHPPSLPLPPLVSHESMSLDEALPQTDILYMTRIQKERLTDEEYTIVMQDHSKYCIDSERMKHAKDTMLLMHPLPRCHEISPEVDSDPRAIYFKQVEHGVYMRMAILDRLFS